MFFLQRLKLFFVDGISAEQLVFSRKGSKMFNKVVLVGNLTRDIELRYASNGNAIGNTAIAATRKFTVNGEKREETCFIDITFFGKMAEIANQYLSKGSKLLVEGRLKLDQWNDQNTGQSRQKHSIVVENMEMLGSPQNQQQGGNGGYQQSYGQQGGGYAPQQGYAQPQQGYAQPQQRAAAPQQQRQAAPAQRQAAPQQAQAGYAAQPQQQGYAQPAPQQAAPAPQAAPQQAQYAPQEQYDDGSAYVEQDETIPF